MSDQATHIQTAVSDRSQIERETRDLLAELGPKLAEAEIKMFRWQRDMRGVSVSPAIDESDTWIDVLLEGLRDEVRNAFMKKLSDQPEYQPDGAAWR